MKELEEKIVQADSLEILEKVRVELFGKKGVIAAQFAKMKDVANDKKKEFAQNLNKQKSTISKALEYKKVIFLAIELDKKLQSEQLDVSKFSSNGNMASTHIVADTMDKITTYFQNLNFSIEEGPLVEDDFHNFQALNLPAYHPARDMQDTFYCNDGKLLRTHTSPVQIRTMLNNKPPIKMIAPGTVFRRDFDITHTPMFNQIEGLVVDDANKITFANLKHIMV